MFKNALAAALLASTAPCAFAQTVDDGSANAPGGAPQRAGLLTGYAVRPGWKVAGVDYAVGPKSGTVFKAASSAPGASSGSKQVNVSTKGVTLDGYDFSGWQVVCGTGCDGLVISNSKFKAVASLNAPIIDGYYGGTMTVTNNIIDGGGSSSAANPDLRFGNGGGTATYNQFINVPNDAINISHDGKFVVRYNLFDTLNFGGGHTDCVQTFFSQTSGLDVQYNTVYTSAHTGSNGGNSFVRIGDEQGNTISGLNIAYNTLIFTGTTIDTQFANVFNITANGQGGGKVLQPTVHDNYIDQTGVLYAIWSPDQTGLVNPMYYGNIDAKTGKPIFAGKYNSKTGGMPTAAPAAPTITSIDGGSISGNGPAGQWITVMSDAGFVGAAQIGSNGSWTVSAAIPSAATSLSARARDALGNASAPSAAAATGAPAPAPDPPPIPVPVPKPDPTPAPPVTTRKCASVTLNGVTATTCLQ